MNGCKPFKKERKDRFIINMKLIGFFIMEKKKITLRIVSRDHEFATTFKDLIFSFGNLI